MYDKSNMYFVAKVVIRKIKKYIKYNNRIVCNMDRKQ